LVGPIGRGILIDEMDGYAHSLIENQPGGNPVWKAEFDWTMQQVLDGIEDLITLVLLADALTNRSTLRSGYKPTFKAKGSHSSRGLIQSSKGVKKGTESRGIQALKKKVHRGDAAYKDLPTNQSTVNKIIRSVMNSPNRIRQATRNQQGVKVIDYFNPSTGQGVRVIEETGAFDTFISI
jgi:hypothetical protein